MGHIPGRNNSSSVNDSMNTSTIYSQIRLVWVWSSLVVYDGTATVNSFSALPYLKMTNGPMYFTWLIWKEVHWSNFVKFPSFSKPPELWFILSLSSMTSPPKNRLTWGWNVPNTLFDHVTATQAQFEALLSDIHKTKFLSFRFWLKILYNILLLLQWLFWFSFIELYWINTLSWQGPHFVYLLASFHELIHGRHTWLIFTICLFFNFWFSKFPLQFFMYFIHFPGVL